MPLTRYDASVIRIFLAVILYQKYDLFLKFSYMQLASNNPIISLSTGSNISGLNPDQIERYIKSMACSDPVVREFIITSYTAKLLYKLPRSSFVVPSQYLQT